MITNITASNKHLLCNIRHVSTSITSLSSMNHLEKYNPVLFVDWNLCIAGYCLVILNESPSSHSNIICFQLYAFYVYYWLRHSLGYMTHRASLVPCVASVALRLAASTSSENFLLRRPQKCNLASKLCGWPQFRWMFENSHSWVKACYFAINKNICFAGLGKEPRANCLQDNCSVTKKTLLAHTQKLLM